MEVFLARLSRHWIDLSRVKLRSWVLNWGSWRFPRLLVLQADLSVQMTQSCLTVASWHLLMLLRQFVFHAYRVMITSSGQTRDWAKHRTIVVHRTRLESFGVVNHLLVVKHTFTLVFTWSWVLSSFLLNYIEYSSPGTFGKLARSDMLLWRQLLLLRYGLIRTWTWHVPPFQNCRVFLVDWASLTIELRMLGLFYPGGWLHTLVGVGSRVDGGAGRVSVTLEKDATFGWITCNRYTSLLLLRRWDFSNGVSPIAHAWVVRVVAAWSSSQLL